MNKLIIAAALAYTLAICSFSSSAEPVGANIVVKNDSNPQLDRQVQELTQQLRCLVCQNQTIADSDAELAADIKLRVREQLVQGASDEQIINFMVQRYGDFVLYRPPLKSTTWLLWFSPIVFLSLGLLALAWKIRGRSELVNTLAADELDA